MSCHKKNGKDGHDGHDGEHGEHGKRGKRGKRGHHGPLGLPGDTGPTGPCCTGPTGSAGNCSDLFTQITEETCTTSDEFATIGEGNATPLCVCFTLATSAIIRIFVSLSADLTTSQQLPGPPLPNKQVFYQVTDTLDASPSTVVFGSRAGSEDGGSTESKEGNAIILQVALAPGQHVICVQWRVGVNALQSACIDPNDETCGMHASLLVEGCDGMTPCPP